MQNQEVFYIIGFYISIGLSLLVCLICYLFFTYFIYHAISDIIHRKFYDKHIISNIVYYVRFVKFYKMYSTMQLCETCKGTGLSNEISEKQTTQILQNHEQRKSNDYKAFALFFVAISVILFYGSAYLLFKLLGE